MNKKELKKQEHVSMEKFLRCYVGIENEKIINWLTSLTHKEIKEVCDEIITLDLTRISFENVTRENIERGEVLLVLDKCNNTAPYTNPIQDTFDMIMEEELEKQKNKIYNSDNQIQSYDEYVDDIDNIVLDKGSSDLKIKTLSHTRYKERSDN